MKAPDMLIKKSPIEGKGVFAARDFRKGEMIIRWDISRQLTAEEAEKLPLKEKKYVIFCKGKRILAQPPERYVNHSCDANTTSANFCDVAVRNIKKGEEITANYSQDMSPGESMECACKSKTCRKNIRRP